MNENILDGMFHSISNSQGLGGLILVLAIAIFLKFLINLIPSGSTKKRNRNNKH